MPSPDLLPRGRTVPDGPAPALEDIVTGAARRRRVQVGVAGAISAVAAVVGVLLLTPGATPGSLKVVTPAQGITTTPRPTGAATPASVGTDGHRSGSKPHGTSTAAAGAAAAAAAAETASAAESASAAPEGPAVIGPPHRVIGYDATRACNGNGPNATTGWCSYYDGATSGAAGHAVTLATAVCRLPGAGEGTLVSDGGQEAEFDVGVKAYPASWSWSHGQRFASGRQSISVAANTCVEWYVTWNVVDDAGHPLRPGSYYLDATPYAQPPDGTASAETSTNQTFTVR